MTDHVKIVIGGSAEDLGRRFIERWKQVEAGDLTPAEPVLIFKDLKTFKSVISDQRVALLEALFKSGSARSIRALAKTLDRDYRRVHDDVRALIDAGLIRQEDMTLWPAVKEVRLSLSFAPEDGADGRAS
ncbi:hypothetical protein JHFBIEKO_3271 [Methylobacterium mesophilicum]|uniref:HVO_A0114 family putative DNA-binding protein n=1 Tax=Methylobacterium mesophilicum TaxID=39956 RepID=UPI001EE36CA7|nr:hypothetical protein [Methylobacterium mesophilicum]GJE22814.1 hypothetical protein JHFBIEKO_3271 [Methylobacterium mesophilicum]